MVEKLFTVQEAADALRIKPATVRAHLLRRQLTYVKVGRCVRIPAAEIERILREGLHLRGPLRDKDDR
jgi:excisionase family DNA binding protein